MTIRRARRVRTLAEASSAGRSELLELLDEAFSRKSWHGPNLRGSIRGLTPAQVGWRPAPQRRSIGEIVAHAAYWKYIVRRRLRAEPRGSFPLPGSNWFALPDTLGAAEWRKLIAILEEAHQRMRAAVADLSPGQLDYTPPGRTTSNRYLIRGIALHDIYHAGQIQSLKALQRGR